MGETSGERAQWRIAALGCPPEDEPQPGKDGVFARTTAVALASQFEREMERSKETVVRPTMR